MQDQLLNKLLMNGDTAALNRLVATVSIDKNNIISQHKDIPPSLYLSKSSIHGMGVFSHTSIKSGQLIETVQIIPLEFTSKYHKDNTIIDYCYAFPDDSDETKKHGPKLFMFTGFGMMYNHKLIHNAKWLWDLNNSQAKLVAIKNILENEEVTIDYGPGYWNRNK